MKAKAFNTAYAVGHRFVWQSDGSLMNGQIVKTVDIARDLNNVTVVEINIAPYFANVNSLKAVN